MSLLSGGLIFTWKYGGTFRSKWVNYFPSSLFYTEARAAFEAGFTTAISVRPGNTVLAETDRNNFRTISTFDELLHEAYSKLESPRKKKSKLKGWYQIILLAFNIEGFKSVCWVTVMVLGKWHDWRKSFLRIWFKRS